MHVRNWESTYVFAIMTILGTISADLIANGGLAITKSSIRANLEKTSATLTPAAALLANMGVTAKTTKHTLLMYLQAMRKTLGPGGHSCLARRHCEVY